MTVSSTTLSSEFTVEDKLRSNRRSPIHWVISHFLNYWYLGLVMLTGAIGNAVLAAVVPVYTGQAFNLVLAGGDFIPELLRIVFLISGSQILRGILQFGRNFGAELIGQRVERNIRHELYVSLLGKGMTFHNLQPVGDTMARATNDVREVNFLFSPGLNLVIGSGIFMIMPLVVAPRFHPALALTPAIFVVSYFIALWQYLNELSPITSSVRKAFGQMNTRLAEAIDGIETVKSMAQERSEVGRFDTNARRFRDAFVRQGDVEARFLPLLFLGLAQAGALLHSLILFRQGALDVGQVVAYFGLIQLLGFPTFVSLFAYSQISLGLAGAERILELINRQTDLDQNVSGYAGEVHGEIEFRDVSFSYGDEKDALHNISFKVKPGQTVAIVGQTGSGKTTLAKLVNRTYDVTGGQVLVDGVDARDWNMEALRRAISIIEQDIFLFSRSIEDNIAFGLRGANGSQADDGDQEASSLDDQVEAHLGDHLKPGLSKHQAVEQAARAAQANEFIEALGDGYQTVIGERGVTLSGGQRQRLALARAFLTDPRILVLDDSTSAIDSATEDKIQRAIYAAARGRTTLIITHRLSQIRWADLILVLRQGKLAAMGTHEELMQSSEAYRRIFSE